MSAENNIEKTESARGGCLDAIVGVITLGKYGVETTVTYLAKEIKPTIIPPGVGVGDSFKADENSAAMIALRSGKTVLINDFDEVIRPQVSRRIIKNQRLG